MSDCVIDRRGSETEKQKKNKKSFVASSLSERARWVQYKGPLFIGHSDKLLFFRSQRKNQYCANVTLCPSTHPPLDSVISISVWRVLFALNIQHHFYQPPPPASPSTHRKGLTLLRPDRHPQIEPSVQVRSVRFAAPSSPRRSSKMRWACKAH